jgi:hypothetical protein
MPLGFCNNKTPYVGVYYYAWYDPNGSGHYNWTTIPDRSILGQYISNDSTIIAQHLYWMQDLSIDFAMISWWGPDSWVDNTTKTIFETAQNNVTNVKLCLLIEAFNNTNPIDYNATYDYVYSTYVAPYSSIYFRYQEKPLLLFYNEVNFTNFDFPRDIRFTVKISGHSDYVDWVYHDAVPEMRQFYYPLPRDRCFPICPRFDDFYERPNNHTVDRTYESGWYITQWKEALALAEKHAIDVVTITSWNEFPERSMIEPHYDRDSFDPDPYYLYNITKQYTCELKGRAALGPQQLWYQNPLTFGIVVIGIAVAGIIAKETG